MDYAGDGGSSRLFRIWKSQQIDRTYGGIYHRICGVRVSSRPDIDSEQVSFLGNGSSYGSGTGSVLCSWDSLVYGVDEGFIGRGIDVLCCAVSPGGRSKNRARRIAGSKIESTPAADCLNISTCNEKCGIADLLLYRVLLCIEFRSADLSFQGGCMV